MQVYYASTVDQMLRLVFVRRGDMVTVTNDRNPAYNRDWYAIKDRPETLADYTTTPALPSAPDTGDERPDNFDHNQLRNRNLSDQHAISAVTGLDARLAAIDASLQQAVRERNELVNLLNRKENLASKGVPYGYASLDISGRVPFTQLPRETEVELEPNTARTLVPTDTSKIIVCTSSSAVLVTVPDGLKIGYMGIVVQAGTGIVSLVPSGSQQINGASSPVPVSAQWSAATVLKIDTNEWIALV